MRARLCGSVSGSYRTEENFLLTKHVVAAGTFAKDAGSTPAASSLRSSAARTKTAAPEPAFGGTANDTMSTTGTSSSSTDKDNSQGAGSRSLSNTNAQPNSSQQ